MKIIEEASFQAGSIFLANNSHTSKFIIASTLTINSFMKLLAINKMLLSRNLMINPLEYCVCLRLIICLAIIAIKKDAKDVG